MLGVECLTQLSSLFSSSVRVRASLATRLLQFLELLVRDDELRTSMRKHFDFLASLSTFLQQHDAAGSPPSKDESTIRCVSLLQRITFGLDTRDESHRHLEFLVGLLVSILLNCGGEDGSSSSSSTPDSSILLPSLALLSNLSKNNSFVQSLVRNHVNIKAFYKRLIACLARKDDTALVICAKSVFANLYLNNGNNHFAKHSSSDGGAGSCYNDRLAEKLFSQSNIRQTFQLVLNCMQKASSSTASTGESSSSSSSLFAQSYGVDLLQTLLQVPAYANCFLAYDHRDAFCRGFLDLLVHVHSRRKTALKDSAGFHILRRFLELIRLLSEFDELKATMAVASTSVTSSSSGGDVNVGTPPFFATLIAIVESGPKLMTRSSLSTAAAAVDVLERMHVIHASDADVANLFVEKMIPSCARVLGVLSEHRPFNGMTTNVTQQPSALSSSLVSGTTNNAANSASAAKKSEAPVESLLHLSSSIYRLLATVIHHRDAVRAFRSGLDFDVPLATVEMLIRQHNLGGGSEGHKMAVDSSHYEFSIDVVLHALRFLAMARRVKGIVNEEATSQLNSLLADDRTSSLVAAGLTSRDSRRVSASVFLLGESISGSSSSLNTSVDASGKPSDFAFDSFASKLALLNADRDAAAASLHRRRRRVDDDDFAFDSASSSSSSQEMIPAKRHASALAVESNKENVFSSFGRNVNLKESAAAASTSNASGFAETKVDALLMKMASTEDAGEIVKDLRTSEILSVYEHKFKSLSMKENHLQDLLDAKALALAQADRLIAQYRCRKAESEVEMTRLRSLLHQSEKEAEKSRDLLNTARLDAERLQGSVNKLEKEKTVLKATAESFKTLQAENAVTVEKLEEAARNNQKLRQEKKTLEEMTDMQKKHNESLRATNDNQAEQIAVLDAASRRLKDELGAAKDAAKDFETKASRLGEEGEALEKEKAKLEESIDSYRKKLDALERANKEQKHQLSSLKVVVEKQEANLAEKEKRNSELEQKLGEHANMISMIQNLTAGKKK